MGLINFAAIFHLIPIRRQTTAGFPLIAANPIHVCGLWACCVEYGKRKRIQDGRELSTFTGRELEKEDTRERRNPDGSGPPPSFLL